MHHTCAVRFDMMENLENFWELNKAFESITAARQQLSGRQQLSSSSTAAAAPQRSSAAAARQHLSSSSTAAARGNERRRERDTQRVRACRSPRADREDGNSRFLVNMC